MKKANLPNSSLQKKEFNLFEVAVGKNQKLQGACVSFFGQFMQFVYAISLVLRKFHVFRSLNNLSLIVEQYQWAICNVRRRARRRILVLLLTFCVDTS